MARTKVKVSNAVKVDANLDMNEKRAVNAADAQDRQDYATKDELDAVAATIPAATGSDMEWAGVQW
ncbi:MAG: hypothetical protein QM642_07555 [Edaphocola sp.]